MTKIFQAVINILLLAICLPVFSQTCEEYNKALFGFLPKDPPKQINCKDEKGKKQGWWIFYTKSYRPISIPNEGDSGEFVKTYQYGQFIDNRRIGDWKTVTNVHQVFEQRVDSYYYGRDTVLIKSGFYDGGWCESITCYNSDSSTIKHKVTYDNNSKTIFIACDRRKNKYSVSCKMTYRNQIIKTFAHDKFELESEKATFMYDRELKQIDKNIK